MVNKTMIENAGAIVPDGAKWTWDDVTEIGRKVTVPEKKTWATLWNSFGNGFGAFFFLYKSMDGKIEGDDGTWAFGPIGTEAWNTLYEWVTKWKITPPSAKVTEDKLSWSAGNLAFNLGRVTGKDKFEAVQLMPPAYAKTGLRVSGAGFQGTLMSQWAKKRGVQDETMDWVIHLSNKDNQMIMLEEGAATPARTSALDSDLYATAAARQVMKESHKYRIPIGGYTGWKIRFGRWNPWWTSVDVHIKDAFDGKLSLKEAMARSIESGKKALTD